MRRREWALAAGALLTGVALPARAEDEGEFLILHARYGTEQNHVDVTERLRELARQDRRFRLDNDVFGVDPDRGRAKVLRIFARDRQGREQTFEYRERDWVDGSHFIGWGGGGWAQYDGPRGWWHGGERREEREGREGRHDDGDYTILSATYGTRYREVDVTDRLRDLARRDQRFRMGNDTFGIDPDPGQTKRLRIVARDRSGRERSFEYPESAWVDGAEFVGWGGGDWGPARAPGGRLVIESARYGADGRWADVTDALRAQARGERLEAEVRNELFGVDPAPRRRKTLEVTYRRGNGPSSTVRVGETEVIRLP